MISLFDVSSYDEDEKYHTLKPRVFDSNCLYNFDDAGEDANSSQLFATLENEAELAGNDESNPALICATGSDTFANHNHSKDVYESNITFSYIYDYLCDGYRSCSELPWYFTIGNDIYCRGSSSCMSPLMVSSTNVMCGGEFSCRDGIFNNVEYLWCTGASSCRQSVVVAGKGDVDVMVYGLGGDETLSNSTIWNIGRNTTTTVIISQTMYDLNTLACVGEGTQCIIYCFSNNLNTSYDNSNSSECRSRFNNIICGDGAECLFYENNYDWMNVPTMAPTSMPTDIPTTMTTTDYDVNDTNFSSTFATFVTSQEIVDIDETEPIVFDVDDTGYCYLPKVTLIVKTS